MSEKQDTTTDQVERPTFDDAYETITGHDGRAIIEHFDGVSVDDLMGQLYAGEKGLPPAGVVTLVQMLEFVREVHNGADHGKAMRKVLGLSRREIGTLAAAYGKDDEPEPFPEEPVTEAGKDDSSPA